MKLQPVFIVRARRGRKEKKMTKERKSADSNTLDAYGFLSLLFFSASLLPEKNRQHHGLYAWSRNFFKREYEENELYFVRWYFFYEYMKIFLRRLSNIKQITKKKGCEVRTHVTNPPFSFLSQKYWYAIIGDRNQL
jgi:hypothetical protein